MTEHRSAVVRFVAFVSSALVRIRALDRTGRSAGVAEATPPGSVPRFFAFIRMRGLRIRPSFYPRPVMRFHEKAVTWYAGHKGRRCHGEHSGVAGTPLEGSARPRVDRPVIRRWHAVGTGTVARLEAGRSSPAITAGRTG